MKAAEVSVLAAEKTTPAPSHIAAPFSPNGFMTVLAFTFPSLTLALATRFAFDVADVFCDHEYPVPLGAMFEPPTAPLPASVVVPVPASVPPAPASGGGGGGGDEP